jgi:prepilin-type N-terminal cleavage/methylation domain-containing protein
MELDGTEGAIVPLPNTRGTGPSPRTVQTLIDARHIRHVADSGFTLIELMVALLILAILLAVAIPSFLGISRSANGRVAQANSNTAMLASQTLFYTSGLQFQPTSTMTTSLGATERNLAFHAGASTNHSQVSVYVAPDYNAIIMAVQSNSTKDCWYTIMNGTPEPATPRTPYRTLPAAVLAAGTFFGEAKAPTRGAAPTCSASVVHPARSGSVAYQRGRFPSL